MRRKQSLCIRFLALAWLALHASTPALAQEDKYGIYAINPGDVLNVSVWREEDLQLTVVVRPDGAISMPLAGEVPAAGKTVEELKWEIAKRLKKYIPEPSVSVAVEETRGYVVYVIGKVARPGVLVIGRNIDVLQALSMAGGMTTFAATDDILVLRRQGGTQSAIPFDYSEIEQGENLDQNIVLQSGDVVVVP